MLRVCYNVYTMLCVYNVSAQFIRSMILVVVMVKFVEDNLKFRASYVAGVSNI